MIRPHLDYTDFVVALPRIEYCINPDDRQDTDVLMVKYNIEELRLRRKRNLVK